MRILVVEDDALLGERLKKDLGQAGFAVDMADNGVDGEFMGDEEPYDAVVLDLGLPKRPGLEVLNNWRKRGNRVPVIILTARDAWHEKVLTSSLSSLRCEVARGESFIPAGIRKYLSES